jgi:Protein of unknown function (DUF2442)
MEFFKYKATEVWITDTDIFVKLSTGEISSLPITNFPLLLKGTVNQKKNVEIINGYALHWPELDEDLSVAGFFENVFV